MPSPQNTAQVGPYTFAGTEPATHPLSFSSQEGLQGAGDVPGEER